MTLAVISVGPVVLVIGLVSLVFAIFVIVDMARRPGWQWTQARSNKALWLTLEILCLILLGLVSIVVGILYFSIVRPRLVAAERQGMAPWQGPSGWPPSGGWPGPPGYPGQAPPPGVPWTGQPGDAQSWPGQAGPPGAYPPPSPQPEETAATEESGPPRYPGEGPPPYPGSAPAPPYQGGGTPYTPTPPVTEAPPFGWYPDPSGRHEQRYWDGTRWTEHVSDGGQQSSDPPA